MNTAAIEILLLIIIANGAPVVATHVFKDRFSMAIDRGVRFIDGRPLFGQSKTWRGVMSAMVVTPLVSLLTGYGWVTGAIIAVLAVIGDVISSFIKRRMKLEPSSMALMLDQVPESLLPVIAMMPLMNLKLSDVVAVVAAFIIIELLLSQILYKIGIRQRPY